MPRNDVHRTRLGFLRMLSEQSSPWVVAEETQSGVNSAHPGRALRQDQPNLMESMHNVFVAVPRVFDVSKRAVYRERKITSGGGYRRCRPVLSCGADAFGVAFLCSTS